MNLKQTSGQASYGSNGVQGGVTNVFQNCNMQHDFIHACLKLIFLLITTL